MRVFASNLLLCTGLLFCAGVVSAEDATFRYYFELSPRSLDELDHLTRSLTSDLGASETHTPIVVVLHGREATAFVRKNYEQNKALVDRTALLDAHGVIEVKMCATWMRINGIEESDILPFIETVPYGPAEIERLREAGSEPAPRVQI